MVSLNDILVSDIANAKTGINDEILPAGTYVAKVLNFTEEEHYNYIALEINKKRFNFFYNYYLRDTTDLDANLLNWLKALATIPVNEKTNFQDITNSAIGSSYRIEIYNYTSKSGKNTGKEQHAINFKTLPTLETVEIEEEELELPF